MTQRCVAIGNALGDLFDRHHIVRWCGVLLALQVLGFAFVVAGTHGLIVPLKQPTTTDFVSFYAAGSLADAGTPQLAYDRSAHLAAEERATEPGIGYQFFFYPPIFLMLCALLARLPYLAAFVVFEAATLVFYLFVARRILNEPGWRVLVPLLAFPIVFWNLGLGQNAFLTAGLFGAATLLIERRPVLAGLLFGALSYKPHFGLLIPVALIAGAEWRAVAGAAASVAALVSSSLMLFGWQTWRGFLTALTGSHAIYQSGRISFGGFVSPFGATLLLGGGPAAAYAVQAAATLAAAVLVAIVWHRRLSLPTRAATLAAATLVAVPVALIYDLMLAAIAGAWLVRGGGERGIGKWEKAAFAVLYLALLDPRTLAEASHVPIGALAALTLVGLVAARAWRESARPNSTAEAASTFA